MSGRPRHLTLLESPPSEVGVGDARPRTSGPSVAFLHQWRAAQIARSRAMHPTNLARSVSGPGPRPLV